MAKQVACAATSARVALAMMLRYFALLLSLSAGLGAVEVPAGTQLQVRLTREVSSQKEGGATVEAIVIQPVINGSTMVPMGAKLSGKTKDARKFDSAKPDTPATLRLEFNKIADPNGHSSAISATVVAVDNARESVLEDGLITGITASQTPGSQMNKGISKVSENHPELGGLLAAVRDQVGVKDTDASIEYPAGVELILQLTKPLNWDPAPGPGADLQQLQPADELAALVNNEPFRTQAANPPSPSDLTNLMFVGAREQLIKAFKDAGWSQAAEMSGNSKMETARAIIESRGYKEGPVSLLTLDGKPPDLVFQKANNTFASRHHIRLWQRPDQFQGQPVWVGAATHDIAINFSKESHSFSHKIDSNIDHERAKVTYDLALTGHVAATSLVDRNNIPANLSNATGDTLETDNKMSVLQLK